ncbi:MAG TPA: hypothetical protein VH986_13675 [Acidimicrobiia bacterium]|jgi:hypothetical protein
MTRRHPPTRRFPRAVLRTAAAAAASLLAGVGLLLTASPAGAVTTPGCAVVISDLQQQLTQLNGTGTTVAPDSAAGKQEAAQAFRLIAAAEQAHPRCKDDVDAFVAKLAAEARNKSVENGTPFLGPIGWLWNNVYYKVFSGNDVMMFLFGWSLLLSPVILVVSLRWVMRGATAGLRRPYVPEHLRFDR